jgi:hypothetical protein
MHILTRLFYVLAAFLLAGCSASTAGNGEYQTGNMAEVQKSVPFTIIIPKYLPSNVRSIKPSFQDSIADTERIVAVSYELEQSEYYIRIEEGKRVHTTVPLKDSFVFSINGIQVIESKSNTYLLHYEPVYVTGFRYDWNRNNIQYNLFIYGYEQNECRKVVESLVK